MNEEYKPITNLWKDFEGYRYFGTLKLSSKIKYDGDDFIPLWEWVKQLQQENNKLNGSIQTYDILLKANAEENKILKENAEHNDKVVDKVNWENMLLKKENQQLKDNWKYIKKMLKEARQEEFNINGYCGTCTDVDIDFLLDKMQELEQGSDSNE